MVWYNIPNLLSLSRIVLLPVLFLFVWIDMRVTFLVFYCIAGLTDALDGILARKLKQETELGKKLDSLGDLFFYLATAVFAWILFPEYIRPNIRMLYVLLALLAASLLLSGIRSGKPMMLHTALKKVGAWCACATLILAFFLDATYIVTTTLAIYILAHIEEIIIFLKHGEVDLDTLSLFHVKK